jgi:outer membrane protein assembly factor BamE
MRLIRLALPLAIALLSASCAVVYKVDVPQGNLVEKPMVESLKPGMTKRQVALIMGTPSIQDPFHSSRWDYAASYQRRGGRMEVKNLTLFFDDNVLAKIEGNYFDKRDKELVEAANRVRGRQFDLSDEEKRKQKRREREGG